VGSTRACVPPSAPLSPHLSHPPEFREKLCVATCEVRVKKRAITSNFVEIDAGFRVQSSEFKVLDPRFRVQGLEFRVQGVGRRVESLGFRV